MLLTDVKQYLIKHKQATLYDLSNHFDIEPSAMRGMLDQWVRKGKIVKSNLDIGCSKRCGQCSNAAVMEVYVWVY